MCSPGVQTHIHKITIHMYNIHTVDKINITKRIKKNYKAKSYKINYRTTQQQDKLQKNQENYKAKQTGIRNYNQTERNR